MSAATDRAAAVLADPRWRSVLARDPAADGGFWYSVTTTGVFCRPSCPSRPARPENVRLHASPGEARAAGARPCRRCDPEGLSEAQVNAARVEQTCRRLADPDRPTPPLAELAAAVELGPRHLVRLFKAATGLTPRAYAAARRAEAARSALPVADSVTQAVQAAGYGAESRFYAEAADVLGMAPAAYRRGGDGERLRFAVGSCSLGEVLIASSGRGVVAVLLGDDAEALVGELAARFPRAELVGGDPDYEATAARAVALVDLGRPLDLPLDVRGTLFQRRVWDALRGLAPGEVLTYAELAGRIGAPAAVRAVAAACAANPHAVATPCHRVVRRGGGLAGYRWGVERKAALLAREGAAAVSPSPPAAPWDRGSGRPRR